MASEHPAVEVDDLAGLGGAGPQLLDHRSIGAVRHEADVLAVGLVRHRQPVARRERPRLCLRAQPPEREPQEPELLPGGREQEVALVAHRVRRPVQLRSLDARQPSHIMPGRHAIGLEIPRGLQKIAELDPLVAADAGHRRRTGQIGVGELVDDDWRGSGPRSRAHSARTPSPPRPGAHHGCPARRSRRPSARPPRRGRRAATSRPRRRSPPRPASPRPPSCRRRPTSRRRPGYPAGPCVNRGC